MDSVIILSEIYVGRMGSDKKMKRVKSAEDPLFAIGDMLGIVWKILKKHGISGISKYYVITKPVVKYVSIGRVRWK